VCRRRAALRPPDDPCANRAMPPLRELDLKFTCIFR
jgi:hypothetical protein